MLLEKLKLRDIKPTAMRLLILREMLKTDQAMSLADLENRLDTVDKSTIFRTVMLFLSHHLAHCVDDGSGALKYAVCDDTCECSVGDLHTHFYCEACHRTFCLKKIRVPPHLLPEENPRSRGRPAPRFHAPKRELRDERAVRRVLGAGEGCFALNLFLPAGGS